MFRPGRIVVKSQCHSLIVFGNRQHASQGFFAEVTAHCRKHGITALLNAEIVKRAFCYVKCFGRSVQRVQPKRFIFRAIVGRRFKVLRRLAVRGRSRNPRYHIFVFISGYGYSVGCEAVLLNALYNALYAIACISYTQAVYGFICNFFCRADTLGLAV